MNETEKLAQVKSLLIEAMQEVIQKGIHPICDAFTDRLRESCLAAVSHTPAR